MTKAVVKTAITRGRKVLVLKRNPHKNDGLRWDFPGGKLEQGETLEEGARREAMEETGMRLGRLSLLSLSSYVREDGKTRIIVIYRTSRASGNIRLRADEHVGWEWREIATLNAKNTAPALLPAVKALKARLKR